MDISCFDLSGVELVKKKYYNAAKVSELMSGARAAYTQLAERIETLEREKQELMVQLEELSCQKEQISDTLMSAQSIARQLVDDAMAQAEETARMAQSQAEDTVSAAQKKAELILSSARAEKCESDARVLEVQDYALRCVEDCVDKLRRQHMDAIEAINAHWQDFLSGLILPEDSQRDFGPVEPTVPPQQPQPVDWMAIAEMELPDLEEQYADIDADTFFSGSFFNEHSGGDIFAELKSMMDSIHQVEEAEE